MTNFKMRLCLGIVMPLLFAAAIAAAQTAPPAAKPPANHTDKVELKLTLPKPPFMSVPHLVPRNTTAERSSLGKHRPPFYVPPGTINVALHKPVTSSDHRPLIGDSNLITDGNKDLFDGSWVTYAAGKQWVQIDLKKTYNLYAIVV